MGINELFENANLSGISDEPDLRVDKVFHKSFVEVNEEGSEAAAATGKQKDDFKKTAVLTFVSIGVKIQKRSIEFHQDFIADHPFLFFIHEENLILFLGRFTNPDIRLRDEL